ncbi:MAG: conjugative transposon protein TraM [Bacteroidetes bacterium 43-16]|uniref:conjugative transposon protein TraM n=1 Tax=Bacteroidota TaxID=976 RepID=UPI0009292EC5|nr:MULTISPECIES: conjugative transposon protein TraM [Bacteroidota]OJV51688.1 MAG: conjugative transposon protein TraM [Bacteroidetes bacterium 43-16]
MKESNNNIKFLVGKNDPTKDPDPGDTTKINKARIKKSLIFGLMGIVFAASLYLIFKPSKNKLEKDNIGLNDAVPQATEPGMQSDKQKAYELDMLEQKDQEKRNGLTTLSDYWSSEPNDKPVEDNSEQTSDQNFSGSGNNGNRSSSPALNSYQRAQSTLGSFYQDNDAETTVLRRELDELKQKLAEKDVPKQVTVDDQIALMEKSYQMAAKYLPTNSKTEDPAPTIDKGTKTTGSSQKETFIGITPAKKNFVSALYREPSDSAFIAHWGETRNRGFYTSGSVEQMMQPKNSIKASVYEEQTVVGEAGVRLRLLESARTPSGIIPVGTLVTALGKFQGGRLQLKISSIEFEGNIIPVDITIYDVDGQAGLNVPYSPEMNALTEMAGNMSQTSGSSIMLTQSAGQQVAADLSRGVVQGISGYFAKKIRTPKVTLKAGHQVFLVSKK